MFAAGSGPLPVGLVYSSHIEGESSLCFREGCVRRQPMQRLTLHLVTCLAPELNRVTVVGLAAKPRDFRSDDPVCTLTRSARSLCDLPRRREPVSRISYPPFPTPALALARTSHRWVSCAPVYVLLFSV